MGRRKGRDGLVGVPFRGLIGYLFCTEFLVPRSSFGRSRDFGMERKKKGNSMANYLYATICCESSGKVGAEQLISLFLCNSCVIMLGKQGNLTENKGCRWKVECEKFVEISIDSE